jgi:hypothetical protein
MKFRTAISVLHNLGLLGEFYVRAYLSVIQGPPKVMNVFQTSVLIRSNFYRKCKVEMKEHIVGFEVLTAVSMKIAAHRPDDGGSKDL